MSVTSAADTILERIQSAEKGYVVEARGLRVLREFTVEEWEEIGRSLAVRIAGAQWALGDWILLHRGDYGERYTKAMAITGLAETTCRQMAKTCEVFPLRHRTWDLPFSYYRYAAGAGADPRELLTRAVDHRWNVEQLWAAIRTSNDARAETSPKIRAARKAAEGIRKDFVRCPSCNYAFQIRGHRITKEEAVTTTRIDIHLVPPIDEPGRDV